ncbi:Xaa-Pro peptidase family protein [Marinobacter sp. 1_MG-2023]|uniref:M24 family metallopeptidase n=1 Tax=Marinobacter sp. 1_MG-2023 TaxID=3062627 RepID=UPI0026E1FBEF|nr:Xaa-Pro peptidase family protein [Marinobacter sp. 1_MG-2023]MDO6823666.1 Xaa-Pro peptidase family protein [Marinobacter sp. 1_MG-2023]
MDYRTYRKRLQNQFPEPVLAFEPGEYEARLASVRRKMAKADLDLLLLTEAGELCYLTGYTTFEVSVQCVLLVSADRTVLFVPAIEIGPAVYLSRVDEVIGYPWQAPETVARELAVQVRRAATKPAPRIGFNPWAGSFRPGLLVALKNELDTAKFMDFGTLIDRVRLVKSPAEIDYLAESATITGAGLDAAAAVIRAGIIDHEIAQAGASTMLGAGSEFMSMQPIVTTGARSGIIHTNHAGYEVARGDVVFTEFGAVRRRYTAPMMRTAVVGEASAEIREFHETCIQVLEAVMSAARAGSSFASAARAGETALEPIADRAFFSGVFGYPVGVAFPPSWVAGSMFIATDNEAILEENMVFHLPICLRKPGEFGIGFSETVRITATGAERITTNSLSLQEIFL